MSDKKELQLVENELGVEIPVVTEKQIQAAYALNLCAVSVSQIIDYNDINILDQEYDNILNLQNMPKDEALLDIIKQLLETITFFRVQEGEKEFIEKDYQHKMKNAIWSAMPNAGALISTGMSRGIIGMTMSLAASVGTAYMNYRKSRTEYQLDKEKRNWELKRTAMEQFEILQQQLFETSWRLADKYEFPDILRLSEKQIKQFNLILTDPDEIRKYERLDSIKDKFIAYPMFWYYFGNTANSIAISDRYGLNSDEKEIYRKWARKYYEYFATVNKYELLREDGISAACYLEYVDLLDPKTDKDKINNLLQKAIKSAGNAKDIMQLCAVSYMRIGEVDKAAYILRQLVNEQYNEVLNAQLLSSIYVNKYIADKSQEVKIAYKLLASRVQDEYLFPMPETIDGVDKEILKDEFLKAQRKILKTKYALVFTNFIKKYEAQINRIVPVPEEMERTVPDTIYENEKSAKNERIAQVKLILHSGEKGDRYRSIVQNIPYSYEILKVLNEMFDSICLLECMQEQDKQLELQSLIKNAIIKNSSKLQEIDKGLSVFDEHIYWEIQEINLSKLTRELFMTLAEDIKKFVDTRNEMSDFAIAEFNLIEFCDREKIDEPEVLYTHKDDAKPEETLKTYFTPDLIGGTAIDQSERVSKNKAMLECIKNSIDEIVSHAGTEFYTQEDSRMERYFYGRALRKYKSIRYKALAILDDHSKGDMDLIFTTEGIMPVIRERVKNIVPYNEIGWSSNDKKKELIMCGRYANPNINMDKLYELIKKLCANAAPMEAGIRVTVETVQ